MADPFMDLRDAIVDSVGNVLHNVVEDFAETFRISTPRRRASEARQDALSEARGWGRKDANEGNGRRGRKVYPGVGERLDAYNEAYDQEIERIERAERRRSGGSWRSRRDEEWEEAPSTPRSSRRSTRHYEKLEDAPTTPRSSHRSSCPREPVPSPEASRIPYPDSGSPSESRHRRPPPIRSETASSSHPYYDTQHGSASPTMERRGPLMRSYTDGPIGPQQQPRSSYRRTESGDAAQSSYFRRPASPTTSPFTINAYEGVGISPNAGYENEQTGPRPQSSIQPGVIADDPILRIISPKYRRSPQIYGAAADEA